MTILDKIIAKRKHDVSQQKEMYSHTTFENMPLFSRQTFSAKHAIQKKEASGIIAEYKRRSPSKGTINAQVSVRDVVNGYERAGASCVSVLTEQTHFGGSLDDLLAARDVLTIPLLRKDFTVDEFQILEARAFGADFILLIAAALSKQEIQHFTQLAHSLHLEVLLEIHTQEELDKSCPEIDLIGINNRNLHDFSVDIEHSIQLAQAIPAEFTKISESGISNIETIKHLTSHGFQGFLMGESFMKQANPGEACADFIRSLQSK
ncbi:MAG: indole-3-glycerol phosphate synthase TrpC [Bacteroidales bacterium]|nr:indole-3-glycerol phosphate synthase TrpC [Bacteroidales bacterium]